MKIGRYEIAGHIFQGELVGDQVYPLEGELDNLKRIPGARPVDVKLLRTLAPVCPTKIIAIGPGHKNMLPEGFEAPDRPYLFFKPPGTLNNPGDPIVYPDVVSNILYELEIGIVIGKTACRVSQDEALDYVLGYTCFNDITAGTLEKDWGTQFSYHWKAFDGFGPMGPVVETSLQYKDVEGLAMISRINGELHAETQVSLIFSPADLVSWISHIMTLNPGDVIGTGAAAKADLRPGDVCEIEIEGIGSISNRVISLSEKPE